MEGIGEDVVYEGEDHVALQQAGAVHEFAGTYTLAEFCELIDGLDLFPLPSQAGGLRSLSPLDVSQRRA